MLKNFLRVAFRQLFKNKVYSIINIAGLSIGLCCLILLSLFVKRELSFDDYHEDRHSIYQVFLADSAKVNGPYAYGSNALMGPELQESIPEVVDQVRFGNAPNLNVVVDNRAFVMSDVVYTDASVIDLMSIDIVAGKGPDSEFQKEHLLISETEAKRLFGDNEAAVGQIIEVTDFMKMEVLGVFKDIPEYSHLEFESLVSFKHANDIIFYGQNVNFKVNFFQWSSWSFFSTYIRLAEEVDPKLIESKIESTLSPHIGHKEIDLVRLDHIYLSDYNSGFFKGKGDMAEVRLFTAIGLVLLLIAIVNYMNLSTARFSKRVKEVGIRKTIGGHRSQLILQFLIESTALTFLALILAIVLAEATIPWFNGYTGKPINLNFTEPLTYLFLSGILVIMGLIAGLYPAYYLSRFSAKEHLTGISGKGKSLFRKVLVSVQFAICLGLACGTLVMFSQRDHMRQIDLGIDTEQVVSISLTTDKLKTAAASIKGELAALPFVDDIKGLNIGSIVGGTVRMTAEAEDQRVQAIFMSGEKGFMNLLDIKMESGEPMTDLVSGQDDKVALINEAFVRMVGWEEPIGKTVFSDRKVVGVVKDFIFESAKKEIAPLMIIASDQSIGQFYVKLTGQTAGAIETIEAKMREFDSAYNIDYTFLDDHFASLYEEEKRIGMVFGLFSVLTIFIAALGILGLSIFIAESRIKEIGIRKVLGARLGQLIWLLNSNITLLVLIVGLVTLPLFYYFSNNWLDNFANRMSLNLLYFLAPLLGLMTLLWIILFYQSYRSASQNPVNVLRNE